MSENVDTETMEERLAREELAKKRSKDRLHLYISIALVTCSAYFYIDLRGFRIEAEKMNVTMRNYIDFLPVVFVALFWLWLRNLFQQLLSPHIDRFLDSKGTAEQVAQRTKVIRQIYDMIYYFSIWAMSRWVVHDQDYPSCVGGLGDCNSLGKYWPNLPLNPKMKLYMIIQFAHHLQNLIHHTWAYGYLANYFEMITHHVGVIITIVVACFMNVEDWALMVLTLHDLSDGLLNFARVTRLLSKKWNPLQYTVILLLNIFWFYDRIFKMGYCYFGRMFRWLQEDYGEYNQAWYHSRRLLYFSTVNLGLIFILNIFWFYEIASITISKLLKGKEIVIKHEGEVDKNLLKKQAQEMLLAKRGPKQVAVAE